MSGLFAQRTRLLAFCDYRRYCKKFLARVLLIERGLLSGLCSAVCQNPLAGMVIRGKGPNLMTELVRSKASAGFPIPDLNDHFAHAIVDFSPPSHRLLSREQQFFYAAAAPASSR